MGTCYYFVRYDKPVAYYLSKAYELGRFFGMADRARRSFWPIAVRPEDRDEFAALLALATGLDQDVGLGPSVDDLKSLAYDVTDWAEGELFSLVDEHDGTIEEYAMRGWKRGDRATSRYYHFQTGSWMHDEQDTFAARRRSDSVFRAGEALR